jgi:hypothetical protein
VRRAGMERYSPYGICGKHSPVDPNSPDAGLARVPTRLARLIFPTLAVRRHKAQLHRLCHVLLKRLSDPLGGREV